MVTTSQITPPHVTAGRLPPYQVTQPGHSTSCDSPAASSVPGDNQPGHSTSCDSPAASPCQVTTSQATPPHVTAGRLPPCQSQEDDLLIERLFPDASALVLETVNPLADPPISTPTGALEELPAERDMSLSSRLSISNLQQDAAVVTVVHNPVPRRASVVQVPDIEAKNLRKSKVMRKNSAMEVCHGSVSGSLRQLEKHLSMNSPTAQQTELKRTWAERALGERGRASTASESEGGMHVNNPVMSAIRHARASMARKTTKEESDLAGRSSIFRRISHSAHKHKYDRRRLGEASIAGETVPARPVSGGRSRPSDQSLSPPDRSRGGPLDGVEEASREVLRLESMVSDLDERNEFFDEEACAHLEEADEEPVRLMPEYIPTRPPLMSDDSEWDTNGAQVARQVTALLDEASQWQEAHHLPDAAAPGKMVFEE
ncbi:hypothetical protein CYMTET_51098 [Cymbomonas tetramitiformis]|uniref:Uncharacterized protein n=1 Tax=Cymbomonas tetramitiformis TaxID=36881 RepID=A0AAE0BMY9_9CHLO|nr:hypothetical protein CYMTET_51098 [Cymbomonas tetramitiformis]